ncbi:glycosyltransferase family 4 protein [Acidicapsa ligni]|uniref:glycosyltransferase family 4 protein n=1 Tax=Acidicapsa ligni TaxID=542300 RepID=UPI0021E07C75|nr:glycosyltransferase family 4 protein [Acidicapsa ligni]
MPANSHHIENNSESNSENGLLRICIVAENASFRFGGEASLPLHYFSRLRARGIEAWLIIHGRTRPELEALFPNEQDRIQYISDKWFHKLIWNLSRPLPRRVSEATFGTLMVLINQLIQRSMVRQLIRDKGIDVVHQPIPVSPKAPSFISGLGVPVIIGPMNGGMDYPAAFRGAESLFTRLTVALGRSSANLVNSIIPGKKNAGILLVANERTRIALPTCVKGKVIEIPENGVDLSIWKPPVSSVTTTTPSRFLFVGRLVDWKRLDFVLQALAQIPGAQLEVIGDGVMRPAWTALAQSLGIADRVRFLGWLPQPECAQLLHGTTALLLPSIYECGGAVVLEAMATATPVVATAWGGPADYINASCGILVNPSNPAVITQGFVDAMRKLIADPDLRTQLGNAGRQRVQDHFDWNRKIDRILEIYQQAIHEHRP